MKPVYIIGHKHPDIDSVAAAIAYKVYKQSTEKGLYLAAAASELNEELKWLLGYLNFESPLIIDDVGTRVEDLLDDEPPVYTGTDTTLVNWAILCVPIN